MPWNKTLEWKPFNLWNIKNDLINSHEYNLAWLKYTSLLIKQCHEFYHLNSINLLELMTS